MGMAELAAVREGIDLIREKNARRLGTCGLEIPPHGPQQMSEMPFVRRLQLCELAGLHLQARVVGLTFSEQHTNGGRRATEPRPPIKPRPRSSSPLPRILVAIG